MFTNINNTVKKSLLPRSRRHEPYDLLDNGREMEAGKGEFKPS